ncbi:alkaline phosphatase family protein [Petrotoga olearia]|uniref:Phosphodiesterase n=2 Tax=Petrotoga olearia TaxID=156203 RepID=A0A2K1P0L1_9BACT|nr:alkaline phosphatase family protein [Petrotoga olearia]PNR96319.1 phosphodiesterase [Petrotoga olearia DSM 13574]RMA76654.1 putative AlkP superfamily phosphohydrolase/phosphomutase [Petrotoga olearia]
MSKKIVIIGLDCASPNLVFDEFFDDLPNLRKIMKNGVYNELESTIPPITVPAWMSMFTGKDPGELGIYGFTNRKNYDYHSFSLVSSKSVKYKKLWDIFTEKGKQNIVIGVPLTYPPSPLKGNMISGFLTPSFESNYTYPKHLKNELVANTGHFIFDVNDFRTEDKERLLKDIYDMTNNHFKIANCLAKNKPWDLFVMVEMGPDRIHHGFWALHDKNHPKHVNSKFNSAIRDYYIHLDSKIGEFLNGIQDDYDVIIVSDHGIKPMYGGIAINDWLIKKGYLVLKEYPKKPVSINKLIREKKIDWSKTKVWGNGGYHGKLFFNIKGREPLGVIEKNELNNFKTKLIKELKDIKNEDGNEMNTKVYEPEKIYNKVNNIPPDLIVYFDELYWRCQGTIGNKSIHTHENDIGPDDANHDSHGIFISSNKMLKIKKITDFFSSIIYNYLSD